MSRDAERPCILFLSQMLPYPPDGGASIRTYNILRLLSQTFRVYALCFYRWKPGYVVRDIQASIDALAEFAAVEAFPIPQDHSRLRKLRDHLTSVATGTVYTRHTFRSVAFRAALERLLQAHDFQLAHIDSLDLSPYLPLLQDRMPVVCTHHDVQSLLLKRRAARQGFPPAAAYFRLQARLMAREERRWCPQLSLNLAVSELDCERLVEAAPGSRCEVVPNGVDTEYFSPGNEPRHGIVSVGGTSWFPNRDGLAYYVDSIAPLIRERLPNIETTWVGRATEGDRETFGGRHGVDLTGYVDDVRPFVRAAACYVVPLRVGGGTRVKILDAWAMGKAVVSTTLGCEGLDARDGENLLVADDPDHFARCVERVVRDEALRERLGANARRTVEQRYSWKIIGENLRNTYASLIGEPAG